MSKYHTIRKTSFDTLWHAVYTVDGRDTWDRIPEGEALRLARELPPRVPEKNPRRLPDRQHAVDRLLVPSGLADQYLK